MSTCDLQQTLLATIPPGIKRQLLYQVFVGSLAVGMGASKQMAKIGAGGLWHSFFIDHLASR
tara:strand:+ start:336 stop:521 length:186 start_codon:yes stop_codon:yes gene_type:complete